MLICVKKRGELAYLKLLYIFGVLFCFSIVQMALKGYCTSETLFSFMGWEGWSFEPRATFKKDWVPIFVWIDEHATILTFSQMFFIQISLYPLMYLDKIKNKGFVFFFVVSHGLFLGCVSRVFTRYSLS